jgi:hypothetical protein
LAATLFVHLKTRCTTIQFSKLYQGFFRLPLLDDDVLTLTKKLIAISSVAPLLTHISPSLLIQLADSFISLLCIISSSILLSLQSASGFNFECRRNGCHRAGLLQECRPDKLQSRQGGKETGWSSAF